MTPPDAVELLGLPYHGRPMTPEPINGTLQTMRRDLAAGLRSRSRVRWNGTSSARSRRSSAVSAASGGATPSIAPPASRSGSPTVSFPKIGQWIWWETKRPKATGFDPLHSKTWVSEPLRPEQARFLAGCVATGQPHAWGGLREAEEVLVRFGLAVRTGRALTLTPSGRAA